MLLVLAFERCKLLGCTLSFQLRDARASRVCWLGFSKGKVWWRRCGELPVVVGAAAGTAAAVAVVAVAGGYSMSAP